MRIHLHILRTHIGPFLFSIFTLMFIFLLQFIMKFIDQLVGKGLSPFIIGELIILSLAWIVVLAVPMSVLVATLMAFGTMSSHNEITAMKASGMSLYRMIATVFLASIILTYLLLEFNNKILPEANHRLKTLTFDIRRIKPTLTIIQGMFSQDIAGYSILAHKTFEKSNDLEGVTIYDYTEPATNVVVTARRAKISFTPDYRKLIMDLYDGEIHQVYVNDMQTYRCMRYNKHRIIMNAEGFDFERSSENAFSRGDRELSAQAMQSIVDSIRNANDAAYTKVLEVATAQPAMGSIIRDHNSRDNEKAVYPRAIGQALNKIRMAESVIDNQMVFIENNRTIINQYLVEINKKYSIPVACIVFVFIGVPLGIIARRGTFGVAATLSIGFFLLYWASLIGGEKLADRGIIPPWIGMWIADIVLGIIGIYLTIRLARETPTVNWSALKRFIPKFLHTPSMTDSDTE